MNPAPSVIVFTVLSGLGFGFLAFLGLGFPAARGWAAFGLWGLGYALAVGGLLASTLHLGHPERAWRAFSQWRSSWLSREGVAAVATLVILAPVALGALAGFRVPGWLGPLGAVMAVATLFSTAMIYAQLAAVPRWNHWTTPATFLAFALTGGAILADLRGLAVVACLGLSALLVAGFRLGDGQFAARRVTMGNATGLGGIGQVSVFEQPHTGGNYLMHEMMFAVGRKHVARLRGIAVVAAGLLPALMLLVLPLGAVGAASAATVHLVGAFAARWLFFAQAEHVVGLYYGRHTGEMVGRDGLEPPTSSV